MSSSISSSDPWRRTLCWFLGSALGLLAVVFLFVALIDPWDTLPGSPPLPRVPVTTNARFTMPALARAARFDSAIIGSSSSRLLRPDALNGLVGGRFVNLAMNAATAWEQSQVLAVFTHAHPDARTVIVGLDTAWCNPAPAQLAGRVFPDWMYHGSSWARYRHILSLFAVQEAGSELWTMLGLKSGYGADGYTSFVPPDSAYDPARVAAAFARSAMPADVPAGDAHFVLPALPMLDAGLRALPAATVKLVFFAPSHVILQGAPGSSYAAMLATCKAQVSAIARTVPNTVVADFNLPSPITRDRASYWDPVHYRIPIADRIMADLASALRGVGTEDDRVLVTPGG